MIVDLGYWQEYTWLCLKWADSPFFSYFEYVSYMKAEENVFFGLDWIAFPNSWSFDRI